jgi:hypothetical protein
MDLACKRSVVYRSTPLGRDKKAPNGSGARSRNRLVRTSMKKLKRNTAGQ